MAENENIYNSIKQSAERAQSQNADIENPVSGKPDFTVLPEKNSPPPEGCPTGGVVHKEIITTINNSPIIRNFVEGLPYNPALKHLVKNKRKAGILSEVLFWQQVHKGIFHKIDFDRQRIIGNYIVDFYVKTLGLVVEIDGSSHDNNVEYDTKRQLYLENLGLKVYRIADIDVRRNIEIVMQGIENYIIQEYAEKTTPVFDHPSKGGEFASEDNYC